MTREEKQKAIDALKISAPVMAVTQEGFSDYIQTLNKIMDWLEQEPTPKNDLAVDTNKLLETCEKMSFDFELFNRHTKALLLDAVKNIVNDLLRATPQEPKPMVEIDLYSVIKQKYIEREVLDKIRAEIAEYGAIWVQYEITGRRDKDIEQLVKDVLSQTKEQVLEIIDKYRAGTENA